MPVKSISELRGELQAKERQLSRLQSQRAKIARQLAALDRKVSSLEGEAAKPKRKQVKRRRKVKKARLVVRRGRRKKVATKQKAPRQRATGKPLAAYIREALAKAKAGLSVTDAMKAVIAAGYRSHSKDFYAIVAKTLLTNKSFRRVTRGVYKVVG